MKELVLKFWRGDDVPFGVRVLTAATSIRWIGWGFGESLIPIFLFTFAGSYAQTGLLRSAYDIAFIMALPIVGMLADRMRATTIILVSMSLYLFVGTGYLLAGLTGWAVFIVVARLFNGVGYAMDAVGRETYFRRASDPLKLATVFGYFDSIANFWWAMAALVGIILVKYFELHWLLFLIAPTSIIAMVIIWKWLRASDRAPISTETMQPRYRDLAREFIAWDWRLKSVVGFNFFVAFAGSVVAFFLPIELFTEGAGFVPIIILGVVTAIPGFFGWILGALFDRQGKKVFLYGLILFAVLLIGLAFSGAYWIQILIAFGIGIILELLYVGSNELVTVYANPEHFGRVSGIMRSMVAVGGMAGPLMAGILIDSAGTQTTYLALALVILCLAAGFAIVRRISHVTHPSL